MVIRIGLFTFRLNLNLAASLPRLGIYFQRNLLVLTCESLQILITLTAVLALLHFLFCTFIIILET
jgi:hypothetical protein